MRLVGTKAKVVARLMVCAAIAVSSPQLHAQYPVKPIRIITPAPPTTAVGILGRVIADGLRAAWGQPAVVEAMLGASGIIGAQSLARAAPDGYTLMATQAALLSYNQSLFPKLPYDPIKDFAPISLLDRKSTRLNSSHVSESRMPSSA